MLYGISHQGLGRGMLASAAACAAMLIGGCMQDQQQPSQRYSASNPGASGAVQASDTSRAPAPSENRVAMAFPTGDRNTSELLVEEVAPREVRVGQSFNYQLRVTNLTNQPLTGVVLTQRVPDSLRMTKEEDATADPNAQRAEAGSRFARVNVGDLGPKQEKTVEMSGVPSRPGQLDTCISAHYNPPTLCAMVSVVAPAVRAVAEGPSQADICQELNYRYTVTNTGTGTARNVVLQENLPEGMQTTDGQKTISANVGDLGQGQSKDVNVRARATRPGRYATDAIVRSDAGEARTEPVTTNVVAPRLAVTVEGPKEDYLGQQITYQITVRNNGDAPARDARVRIGATPGKVQFAGAQNAEGAQLASEQPGTGQMLGTLNPGEAKTVGVTFTPLQGGPLSLDATAHAQCATDVTTPINANIVTLPASALVVTHNPDPVRVGTDVVYHITVENKGTAVDHNVHVTADLPGSEQFLSVRGETQGTANGRTITFGPIQTLEPKQRVSWDVKAKALRADDAALHVHMTSDSTTKTAEKIEPTKLYGGAQDNQQNTREAQQPARVNEQAPAPPPAPAPATPDANK